MVILKINGNLIVNENVTITACKSDTGYGGPKGFMLYVTGKLTNNGTIDNSHGAKAIGQDVYLWKNADGTYEYIPAAGAAGGAEKIAGAAGVGRSTGGGAGAGAFYAGAAGTSYSGGSAGGSGSNASANGGAGGNAWRSDDGAGAGNPAGVNGYGATSGTGGLLILYSNEYVNNGVLSANGSAGGPG